MSGIYFLDPGKSAEDYEQMAREVAKRQQERLDRNRGDLDDCFVSDRCDDLTAQVYQMLAALVRAENAGWATGEGAGDRQPLSAVYVGDHE